MKVLQKVNGKYLLLKKLGMDVKVFLHRDNLIFHLHFPQAFHSIPIFELLCLTSNLVFPTLEHCR